MSGTRFIALTTDDLRSMLERAWDIAPEQANSLLTVLKNLETDFSGRASDNVFSSSQNNHSSSTFFPGQNAPSDTEIARGFRRLIDTFRSTAQFLRTCSKFGFDAFAIRAAQAWPTFPAALPAAERAIVDTTERWADLCDKFEIPTDTVSGQLVSDEAVFLWMMDNLIPVTESRADYSGMIIGQGGTP